MGHLIVSCPERRKEQEMASSMSAYFVDTCSDVAWNLKSHKYLLRGKVDGKPVRMLVDTGCDRCRASKVGHSRQSQGSVCLWRYSFLSFGACGAREKWCCKDKQAWHQSFRKVSVYW